MSPEKLYHTAPVQLHTVKDAGIALRRFGNGPALLFIHGYPVHGYTWRKLLPALSKHYTCLVIDLPGLGSSEWSYTTDFTFTAQANRIVLLMDALGVERFSIIAQNTGATLARMVALQTGERVSRLVLFNTEIPGHRPPYIPLYQKLAKLPGIATLCRYVLQSKAFIRSRFGFGQFYYNQQLFNEPEYLSPYIDRLKNSINNIKGGLHYQAGIEWEVIDRLRQQHRQVAAKTLLLWGENDLTFPVELAELMSKQFQPPATFIRLKEASLMPQEEVPEKALEHIIPFLKN